MIPVHGITFLSKYYFVIDKYLTEVNLIFSIKLRLLLWALGLQSANI